MAAQVTGDAAEVLKVDGVSVQFSRRLVLDDVRFSVRAGEFTGLIGSNGAGKTTLLRVILGLVQPSSGSVAVGGAARSRSNPLIGYVPQQISFDQDMPIRARDLVALGLDGHRFGIPIRSGERRARTDEVLSAVNAMHLADKRVGRLSGGEQQRIMIAHALISRPRLLLLDEPLANLDLRSEQEVVELLDRIAREQEIAILMSAHDVNPLLPVMNRVVYLADGRAVSGTTDEVIRSDTLTRL